MSSPQKNVQSHYFLAIDGLRLFASLNIVLFHLEYIGAFTNLGGSPGWFFRIIKGPSFHASLFFLLGGFIFTSKFSLKANEFRVWPFLKKRFKELYPLHVITTCMMILLVVVRQNITGSVNVVRLMYSAFLHLSFLWPIIPFNSHSLNTPSWALAAFFLCYLLFGVLLRFVNSLTSKVYIILSIFLCFVPLIIWDVTYALLETPQALYLFFHIFAPIRVFEFAAGMLLARFFLLNPPSKNTSFIFHVISDVLFLTVLALIFYMLGVQHRAPPSVRFFSYHVILPFFFMCILYIAALEKGLMGQFLSLPFIRKLGRCSFYPYLLHIPIISWISFFASRFFNNKNFLHDPTDVWIFVGALYGVSYIYVNIIKKSLKRKKIVKEHTQFKA